LVLETGLIGGDGDGVGLELTRGFKGIDDGKVDFKFCGVFEGAEANGLDDKLDRLAGEFVVVLADVDVLETDDDCFDEVDETVGDFVVASGAEHFDPVKVE